MNDTLIRKQAVEIVLGMAPVQIKSPDEETHLVNDLGYDSLRLVELGIALEEHFGITVVDDETPQVHTLGDVEATAIRLVSQLAN